MIDSFLCRDGCRIYNEPTSGEEWHTLGGQGYSRHRTFGATTSICFHILFHFRIFSCLNLHYFKISNFSDDQIINITILGVCGLWVVARGGGNVILRSAQVHDFYPRNLYTRISIRFVSPESSAFAF